MERIRLSKEEKQVLRLVSAGKDCPATYPSHVYNVCADSLERKGLVKVLWAEGRAAIDAYVTDYGKTYMSVNPKLRNPIDKKWIVSTALGAVGAVAAIIALLIACSK